MTTKHKYDSIAILGLVGFSIAFYLTVTHYINYVVPCSVTHGCEYVLTSKYAMAFGLPVALWGVIYFSLVIISSLMANHYAGWRKFLTVLLSLGALASLGLLSLQFFVIKKVCEYCFTVDCLNILLFLLDINIGYKITMV